MYNVHILCFIIFVSILSFAVLRQREVGGKCMPSYVLSNSISMSLAVKFEEVLASFLLHMLADKCWHEMCVHIQNSQ
jgi:hypothetical protein